MSIVFFALTTDRARQLRNGTTYAGPGHTPGPALLSAHGLAPGEEADFTALAYAGVAALAQEGPLRLVLAADVPADQVRDGHDPLGSVDLSAVRWDQVTALFADDMASAPVIAEARSRAAARPLADLVDDPELERLLDSVDLLWFAPTELDFLWSA